MLLVVFGVRNKTFISFCLIKLNYNFFTDGNFYFLFEFHPSGRISSSATAHQSGSSANNSKSYRDFWTPDVVSFFLMISYSQLRGQYTNKNTSTWGYDSIRVNLIRLGKGGCGVPKLQVKPLFLAFFLRLNPDIESSQWNTGEW